MTSPLFGTEREGRSAQGTFCCVRSAASTGNERGPVEEAASAEPSIAHCGAGSSSRAWGLPAEKQDLKRSQA